MQIGFQFVGGGLGIPMRLLQNARALDLPIEGGDSTPFSETVASTITLRIWVRNHPFGLDPGVCTYPRGGVYSGRVTFNTLDE